MFHTVYVGCINGQRFAVWPINIKSPGRELASLFGKSHFPLTPHSATTSAKLIEIIVGYNHFKIAGINFTKNDDCKCSFLTCFVCKGCDSKESVKDIGAIGIYLSTRAKMSSITFEWCDTFIYWRSCPHYLKMWWVFKDNPGDWLERSIMRSWGKVVQLFPDKDKTRLRWRAWLNI